MSAALPNADSPCAGLFSPLSDEDLRSARFFDVAKYPTMTYRSSRVAAELDGRWTVEGNLTIRDVTLPIPLRAEVTGAVEDEQGHIRLGIHAKAAASRKDFGMLTDLEHENGGLILRNDIVITIDAEALLQR
jgi:polyisoprenoid-binding protein YceI